MICMYVPLSCWSPQGQVSHLCVYTSHMQMKYSIQGQIMVFDDSKHHFAFNRSTKERVVLIVDLLRPSGLPLGTAVGGHTRELDSFIAQFR